MAAPASRRAAVRGWVRRAALPAALFALALAARSAGGSLVFVGGGEVQLQFDDGAYHARRAYYTFARPPSALVVDPLLAHPGGAHVPWPPLYDQALGLAARAFGRSDGAFTVVAALASPVLGALVVLPIFAVGRRLGGSGVAAGAAALYALLPVANQYAAIGNPDHHAAVALLAACHLASCLRQAALDDPLEPLLAASAALRAALAGAWAGSLLYLGLGEAALLLAGVVGGRPRLLAAQALAASLAAALLVPLVAAQGTPIGGPFTTTTLSWLHPLVLLATGAVAGLLAAAEAARPSASAAGRLARAGALAGGAALALLALPELRDGLGRALEFVGKSDPWSPSNIEQQPLFGSAVPGAVSATALYGWLAWLVPAAPLGVLVLGGVRREVRWVFAAWVTVLAGLAFSQVRFGNDFAAPGCVAFALLGAAAARRLPLPRPAAAAVAAAALGALLVPGLRAHHLPRFEADRYYLWGAGRHADRGLALPSGALARFATRVGEVTPAVDGFLDPSARPAYGIAAPATFGHALHWYARRATSADNFGPWLDAERFAAVTDLYESRKEAHALAILDDLDARYVLTHAGHSSGSARVVSRLFRDDGAGGGHRRLAHFRLVAEGPAEGKGFAGWSAAPGQAPYKLFERVAGAVLAVSAPPAEAVTAQIELETDTGRRFVYLARASRGDDGLARLRVPYASDADGPVRATGPYRVRVGAWLGEVEVGEGAVVRGEEIGVQPEARSTR